MAEYDPLPPGCYELPNGEVVLKPFMVLDEHEYTDHSDGQQVVLNRDRLQQIADNANRRLQGPHPDECPIIIGHTDDDKPEIEQPEIVGWARDWKVVPFKDGKSAIQVTPVAKNRKAIAAFKKFVRRSVEFWKNTNEIDPIALLGATTPKRDLGTYRLSRKFQRSGRPYLYSCESTKMDMSQMDMSNPDSEPTGDDALIAKLLESAPMKELMAKVNEICAAVKPAGEPGMEGMDGMPPGMPPGMEPGMGAPEGEGMPPDMGAMGTPPPPGEHEPPMPEDDEEDDEEEHPRKTEMAMHYSRNNQEIAAAYEAGQLNWRDYLNLLKGGYIGGGKPTQMSRKQTPVTQGGKPVDRVTAAKFERIERDYKTRFEAQQKQIQSLLKKNLEQEIDAELIRLLEVDRIDFDPTEEKTAMMKMNKQGRDAHVEKMRRRYQKLNPTHFSMEASELRVRPLNNSPVPNVNAPQNADEGMMAAILQAEAQNKGQMLEHEQALKMAREKNGHTKTVKVR